jgi:hypothetical protein
VFQRYQLKTRIVGWDDKWFFVEQIFESNNQQVAIGYLKGLFVSKGGSVSTAKTLDAFKLDSPAIPEQILKWQESDYWTRPFP